MKQKELKIVITFHTTAEAIAMEKLCKAEAMSGRLIPVPRQISASCGLAWCSKLEDGKKLLDFLANKEIYYEKIGEYLL